MIVEEVVVDSVVHFPHVGHFSTNELPTFGSVGVVVPSPHGGRRSPYAVVNLFVVAGLQGVVQCSLRRVNIMVCGVEQRIAHPPYDGDGGDGLRIGVVAVVCPLYLEQVVGHDVGFAWQTEFPTDV